MPREWPDNFRSCEHNALVAHKLSYLRQPASIIHFRDYESLIYELGILLAYEASQGFLEVQERREWNGDEGKPGYHIDPKPVIVPIVRSGLVLAQAMRSIIPTQYMGHIGIFTPKGSDERREFMVTMPFDRHDERQYFIADLFVDNGKTARRSLEILLELGVPPSQIAFVALIISSKGCDELVNASEFNDVRFICARLDDPDDPWLGDYQQTNIRLFGTTNHNEDV